METGASSDARARIQNAAIRCLVREGTGRGGAATMAAIARESGTSKALLHYHFRDREALLAGAAEALGRALASREHALWRGGTEGPLDLVWRWVADELARGELAALLHLPRQRSPAVRAAAHRALMRRERSAAGTVATVLERLSLRPRFPVELLGATHATFVAGAALQDPLDLTSTRARFDVLWLGLLELAE